MEGGREGGREGWRDGGRERLKVATFSAAGGRAHSGHGAGGDRIVIRHVDDPRHRRCQQQHAALSGTINDTQNDTMRFNR